MSLSAVHQPLILFQWNAATAVVGGWWVICDLEILFAFQVVYGHVCEICFNVFL